MNRYLVPLLIFAAGVLAADDFTDLAARANAAREANNVPQAIALYRKALDLKSRWQEGWWFLGTLLYDSDDYPDGRDAFQHFVELDANAAPGWGFLGLCEFETGDYANASRHIDHALSLGADKEPQLAPVLLYHQGLLETRAGEFDQALGVYGSLLRNEPQGGAPNGSLLISVGLAALRDPILPKDVDASQRDLYLAAGKTASFVLMQDYADAESGFADLLARYPKALNVHYMHGLYLLARDPEAALDEFRAELAISPDNSAADRMLAWGLLTQGDAREALPYAEAAERGQSAVPFAQYLLGRALVETGNVRGGLEYLLRAERTDPKNVDTHVVLAAAYSRLGQPQEARREREIALRMTKEMPPVAQP